MIYRGSVIAAELDGGRWTVEGTLTVRDVTLPVSRERGRERGDYLTPSGEDDSMRA